jgi:stearoyl-CoA desaturase (delta-9 desaturase)
MNLLTKFNTAQKIKALIILNHAAVASFFSLGHGLNKTSIITCVVAFFLINRVGGDIGYHRYFAHRSFKTFPILEKLLLFLGMMNGFGSCLSWVGIHRKHHMCADTESDPHSPITQKPYKVWLTMWKPVEIQPSSIRDVIKSPQQRWTHRHYFRIYLLVSGLLAAVSLELYISVLALPAVIAFHSAGLTDVIGHMRGYQNFETKDQSRNSLVLNYLTLGTQGLHNNHHARPSAPSQRYKPYEVDTLGLIIKLLLEKKTTYEDKKPEQVWS